MGLPNHLLQLNQLPNLQLNHLPNHLQNQQSPQLNQLPNQLLSLQQNLLLNRPHRSSHHQHPQNPQNLPQRQPLSQRKQQPLSQVTAARTQPAQRQEVVLRASSVHSQLPVWC